MQRWTEAGCPAGRGLPGSAGAWRHTLPMAAARSTELPAAELLDQLAGADLEGLVRVVLETAARLTGLESSYLTFIDWPADVQKVLFSNNTGELAIPEGAAVPWQETMCRRALVSGVHATADADAAYGTDNAGHDLGIVSYVSVPVLTQDQAIFGTLCAASTRSQLVDDDALELLRMLAHLLGRQVDTERALERERARAERAEQRTRARLLRLAESEHRVKTPLTVIRGASLLLEERWDELADERRREMVTSVARQSTDLLGCIQELLAQARGEMDDLLVPQAALYLEPILEEVATDHRLASQDHTISVSCEGPVVVRADGVNLRQLLGHLIDNAIKYTPAGGTISIAARAIGDRAVITVADDGPGLPADMDPFAAFTRGSEAPELASGSGLGLHIVRSIATRLGGSVTAGNGAGGAEFVIELPAA